MEPEQDMIHSAGPICCDSLNFDTGCIVQTDVRTNNILEYNDP